MNKLFYSLLIIFMPILCEAQEEDILSDSLEKPDLTLEKKLEKKPEAAELKKKRNTYYGIKVKPSFTRNISRNDVIIEEFYYLKEPTAVDRYVTNIYILDRERNRVRGVRPSNKPMEYVLHGPYQKFKNGILIEDGMYFYGTKHERWLTMNEKEELLNKEHFVKGWYRDSELSYYDAENKNKLKEFIPVQYGYKEGAYYYFYPNGKLAVKGQFQFDKRIGIWEEYYDAARTTIKREIQYPKDAFDPTPPYIRKEWDSRGNTIYTSPKVPGRR